MNSLTNLDFKERKVLSEDESKELISKSQQGDKSAKDKLIEHNLRLVLKIAHRFRNSRYSLEDIFQVGTIGLIKAITRFDISRDVKFSTYAVPVIIGEIKVFLRDDNPVKVGRKLKREAYKIKKAKEKLMEELGREPSIKELSNEIDLSVERIIIALEANQDPKSLYSSVYQNEDGTLELVDQLADEVDQYNQELTRLDLARVLKRLDYREQRIIKFRYFAEKSQSEIAEILGISQAQVSRLEKKILVSIRKELEGTYN